MRACQPWNIWHWIRHDEDSNIIWKWPSGDSFLYQNICDILVAGARYLLFFTKHLGNTNANIEYSTNATLVHFGSSEFGIQGPMFKQVRLLFLLVFFIHFFDLMWFCPITKCQKESRTHFRHNGRNAFDLNSSVAWVIWNASPHCPVVHLQNQLNRVMRGHRPDWWISITKTL